MGGKQRQFGNPLLRALQRMLGGGRLSSLRYGGEVEQGSRVGRQGGERGHADGRSQLLHHCRAAADHYDLVVALKYLFVLSMIANGLASVASLFLGIGKTTSNQSEKAVDVRWSPFHFSVVGS